MSEKVVLYIVVISFFLLTFFTWGEAGTPEAEIKDPMVCVTTGSEFERCQNEEVICYRNDRYGLGGISCWEKK